MLNGVFSMNSLCRVLVGLCAYSGLQAAVIDLNKIEQKKQQLQSFITKKKEQVKNIKKKKDQLLERFSRSSFLEDKEAYNYLESLLYACQSGSIEALNLACELFDTNNISHIEEAILTVLDELGSQDQDSLQISLCTKYIGDDGMEYDDGKEEDTTIMTSFYNIPIHQWEKKVIEKIISSMGEKSLAQLLLDKKEMEKRGDQIRHVHPLRFLSTVFNDPYLKMCMQQFKGNYFKWTNFIDGYSQRMREEAARNNLLIHLEGFCEYLNVDYEKVVEIVKKENYEELVSYLIQV